MNATYQKIKGRGSFSNPANRFDKIDFVPDEEFYKDETKPKTEFFKDTSKDPGHSREKKQYARSFKYSYRCKIE